MQAVRAKGTRPEMIVRRLAHLRGLRFRVHRTDLPGKPDLVFPRWRTVILVNGCFWHQHPRCKKASMPLANRAFWKAKLSQNIARDRNTLKRLKALGWRVHVIWECQTRDAGKVDRLLARFFDRAGRT